MNDFQFQNTTKVYFGKDQLQNLHTEVLKHGSKVLFAYGGGSLKRTGLYDKVIEELKNNDIEVYELAGVEPNPRHTTVNKGVQIVRENNIPCLLAVGGGSTIDCCKAIAATVYTDIDDVWKLVKKEVSFNKALPVIAMPTIASTGSEMDTSCQIANVELHVKGGLASPLLRPVASFLNPENTYTVPKRQSACGGFDIMMHLLDMNYFVDSPKNPLQFNVVETLVRTLKQQLQVVMEDPTNYKARGTMLWVASLALNSFCTSGFRTLPSIHSLEQLSAFYDQTHGQGLAIILPKWMRYLLNKDETVIDDFARFAVNIMECASTGNKKQDALNGIEMLESYVKDILGLATTLTELGINDEKFEDMAKAACRGNTSLKPTYRELSIQDCINIYKMCL